MLSFMAASHPGAGSLRLGIAFRSFNYMGFINGEDQ